MMSVFFFVGIMFFILLIILISIYLDKNIRKHMQVLGARRSVPCS